jgi:RNA polymerase sigma-70 factor (ECF subfamily)
LQQEQEGCVLNEITRTEVLREVYAELQKLPAECRKVMQLYYQQGLDHKSISAELGVTVSTVKNQKARGLQILRKKLGTSFLFFLVLFG